MLRQTRYDVWNKSTNPYLRRVCAIVFNRDVRMFFRQYVQHRYTRLHFGYQIVNGRWVCVAESGAAFRV